MVADVFAGANREKVRIRSAAGAWKNEERSDEDSPAGRASHPQPGQSRRNRYYKLQIETDIATGWA